ncbi:hypothetical protein VP01_1335g5 [Puccinia sorghi]|uniref:Uncharacterized protein n=1 Tax=Puccinia sorghi TaxID=27349 RepID=A0A0L6VME4_9BASI|nr:hypothetical protein VP01_1335g5 [Puccinia sorghi]
MCYINILSTRQPRKSITPQKLNKPNSAAHELDNDLAQCLMNRLNATSPVPDAPYLLERRKLEGYFNVSLDAPSDSAGIRIQQRELTAISSNSKIDQDYIDYVHGTMRRWGIARFTMDWEKHYDDRYNQKWGLAFGRFGPLVQQEAAQLEMDELILMAIYWRHIKNQAKKTQRQTLKWVSILISFKLFNRSALMNLLLEICGCQLRGRARIRKQCCNLTRNLRLGPLRRPQNLSTGLNRRSQHVSALTLQKKMVYGVKATLRPRKRPDIVDKGARIPIGLPEDWYDASFLSNLSFADKKALEIQQPLFSMIGDFQYILPQSQENFHTHPSTPHIDTVLERENADQGAGDDSSDKCEFEGSKDPLVKLEEDKEML